jgi:hypothetical protein
MQANPLPLTAEELMAVVAAARVVNVLTSDKFGFSEARLSQTGRTDLLLK